MLDFAGANVVVTGGTGALGRAVVAALLKAGAACHIPNFDAAELASFDLAADPAVHIGRGVDLGEEEAVQKFYRGLPPLWASIHLAGGFAMAPVGEISGKDLMAQFRLNALTAFLCSRAAIAAFRGRPSPGPQRAKGGRIVNVAARPALEPRLGAGMVAYTASKAAVAALTQALAQEVAEEDIFLNAVAPSVIDTPANRAALPDADHARWVSPAALAEVILFLASPDNRATRGAVVPVYGQS